MEEVIQNLMDMIGGSHFAQTPTHPRLKRGFELLFPYQFRHPKPEILQRLGQNDPRFNLMYPLEAQEFAAGNFSSLESLMTDSEESYDWILEEFDDNPQKVGPLWDAHELFVLLRSRRLRRQALGVTDGR